MLTIEHLTKTYCGIKAVDDISFAVEPGQIVAFIGANGAGKTTTLKAIAGIINFDQGEILVDGKNVLSKPMETKMAIGYLPDNPDLYENIKGIDYLNFIADAFNIDEKTRKERIKSYSQRLEIFENLGEIISTYSHGMKQKLALVSVLLHKPKLYLMDEPFVGLDPKASHELKLIMSEECKNGSAFLYSTHVLEVAEKICSHVVIIKKGEIMGFGTMEEVKGDKTLENLFLELNSNA